MWPPLNGLVDRFRLPELFLGRVESRCDKVVAIPKGPVDELLPVFGNDGLLYIVSLVINATRREARPTRKTSMSFVTALGLSARNLMTKKGRTAMTAFAGSIGIIGIAAILALSNGVNGYIKKVEEDTLSGYPLTISKQDYDLSSMMGGQGATDDEGGTVPLVVHGLELSVALILAEEVEGHMTKSTVGGDAVLVTFIFPWHFLVDLSVWPR